MIKINESWSFPQSSIKCNYCIQHTVKLLWRICWDIIYATYLQRGIDPTLWISYKRAVECKLKEICGYWVWSIIWLIMTYFLNSPPYCTVFFLNLLSLNIAPADFLQRITLPCCPSESRWSPRSTSRESQEKAEMTWQIWVLFFERQTIFANPKSGGFPAQPAPILWWDPVLRFLLCIGSKSNSK